MAGRFSVEAVFKAVDRMTGPVNRMQRRFGRFTKSVERGLRRVDKISGRITRGLVGIGKAVGTGLATAGGAAGTAVTMLNKASVRSERLAKSVGANVDRVEAIAGSVKSAGFELNHVVDMIEEMNNKIGESKGLDELSRPTAEAMKILNIEFDRLQKLSPGEQFELITDKALKMKDAQKAASAADILMGGEANKLIGVLRQKGDSLSDITERFNRLNARTDASRKGARRFVSALDGAQFAVTSLGQEIAGLVGAQLAPLIKRFTEFVATNKDLIKTRVLDWFNKVRDNFGQIVTWLERIGIGIAVWFTFISVLKTFIAVMTAVNIVMAMNPIGLIVIGVMAAVAAIALLIANFGKVKDWFMDLPAWGKVAFAALTGPIGWIISAASMIMEHWEPIKGFFIDLWDGIKFAFQSVMDVIGWVISAASMIMEHWEPIKGFFIDLWDGVKTAFQTVADVIDDKINSMLSTVLRVINLAKRAGRFFGFGGDEDQGGQGAAQAGGTAGAGAGGQMVSPQQRIVQTMSENVNTDRSEVVIRDETGRAEQRGRPRAGVLRLEPTGAG